MTFSFDKAGIEFAVFGKKRYRYPWNAFSQTYVVQNYRRFRYIVLSPREQKRIIYFRTIYTKIHKDGILAISLDERSSEKLEHMVANDMK